MDSDALIKHVRDALDDRGFTSEHLSDDEVWSYVDLMLDRIVQNEPNISGN